MRIEEERQIVRGTGTNDLVGIMGATRGINVYSGGTAAGNKAVQLFKAMNGQRGSALIEPDFIVINTTDWEAIRLLTDTAGQFFGGGPFLGPYGGPQGPIGASGQTTGAQDSIWGKPTIVTSVLGSGTALIGTSSAAQVWRRGGHARGGVEFAFDVFRGEPRRDPRRGASGAGRVPADGVHGRSPRVKGWGETGLGGPRRPPVSA